MVVDPKSCYPGCGGAKQYPLNKFLYHIICFLLLLPPAHVVDSLVCPSLSQPPPVQAPARPDNSDNNRGIQLLFDDRDLLIVDSKRTTEFTLNSGMFLLSLSIKFGI